MVEEEKVVEYTPIEPGIWKPEKEGDEIEGILIDKREGVGTYSSNAYMIENREGQHLVWGSTVLDDGMNFIKVGEQVKIQYKGTEENKKGQKVKIYKVYKGN